MKGISYCSKGISYANESSFSKTGGDNGLALGDLQSEQHSNSNPNNNDSGCGSYYSAPSASVLSPFIVYRSAKYVRPHARALQTLENYAKHYVLLPAKLIASRCKDAFYHLCGLVLFLVIAPLFAIPMSLVLYITRRLRFLLISRFYPSVVQLDDRDAPATSDSPGIVNFLIWTNGRLEAPKIRQRFKILFTENPTLHELLRLRLSSRLGQGVWETCDDFTLEHHIVEAPKRFHNCPIVDEPLKELYRTGSNKSILQKYVSFCASAVLSPSSPPWKIHVVSYISREDGLREKTCLVIRMHVGLIKNQEVSRALRELFLNSREDHPGAEMCGGVVPSTDSGFGSWKPQVPNWKVADVKRLYFRIKKIGLTQQKGLTVWINLRIKQLEFHSKSVVISLIFMDAKDSLLRTLSKLEVSVLATFSIIAYHLERLLINLLALAAIPIIILSSFIRRSQLVELGFKRTPVSDKRLISWSDLIYADLVQEICGKVGGISPENLVMTACSRALKDYYQLNNMEIPSRLGFSLRSAASPCSSSSHSFKNIYLPVNANERGGPVQKLKSLEEKTQNYPEWKILGLAYIAKYLRLILPDYLSHIVHKSILSCYPFSFTYADLQKDGGAPTIHQLFDNVVEDFTFWTLPPSSDLGVSITLVHYTGKMRLYVMSPFPSIDTILTHRCNQYLIKIAEEVGVDRGRIPYSRRSSPASTSCATPQLILPFGNLTK